MGDASGCDVDTHLNVSRSQNLTVLLGCTQAHRHRHAHMHIEAIQGILEPPLTQGHTRTHKDTQRHQ